jgi:hypothetical protein
MVKRFGFASIALLVLTASMAQAPPSGAWLSGPVVAVSEDSLTLQGLNLAVAPEARFATVRPDGTFAPIAPAEMLPGQPLHGRFVLIEGVPALVHGFVGNHFFWHGVVTAVNADAGGLLLSFEVDGMVTLHASQARVVGVEPGGEGGSGMDDLCEPADGIPADLIRVGATVGAGGIVRDGVFAVAHVNVAALTFRAGGKVSGLVSDDAGHVVGFTLATQAGEAFAIGLDPRTIVREGRRQVLPDALREGSKVKVEGWTRGDGTILARDVEIKRPRSGRG